MMYMTASCVHSVQMYHWPSNVPSWESTDLGRTVVSDRGLSSLHAFGQMLLTFLQYEMRKGQPTTHRFGQAWDRWFHTSVSNDQLDVSECRRSESYLFHSWRYGWDADVADFLAGALGIRTSVGLENSLQSSRMKTRAFWQVFGATSIWFKETKNPQLHPDTRITELNLFMLLSLQKSHV